MAKFIILVFLFSKLSVFWTHKANVTNFKKKRLECLKNQHFIFYTYERDSLKKLQTEKV